MTSPYATNKLAWHPAVLEKLRRGDVVPPIFVQLFPTGVCNQSCEFCSYGSGPAAIRAKVPNPGQPDWKNQQLFAPDKFIPWVKAEETLICLAGLGCKAVEISGGGEPTVYPHFAQLVLGTHLLGMDVSLVSNGVLLTGEKLDALREANFIWARISIDAGTREDYVRTRYCPEKHWDAAWAAVRALAASKRHAQASVGVGFVVDRHNAEHVYEACALARDAGADNIRLSVSFTPDKESRWNDAIPLVLKQVDQAKHDFGSPTFYVNDLAVERVHNVKIGRQLYTHCLWKDVACVIGHDQNVYACCSWAMNTMGRMFSITNQTFKEGWLGDGAKWREIHDPRKDCRIHCLYEARNIEALRMLHDIPYAESIAQGEPPPHKDFI